MNTAEITALIRKAKTYIDRLTILSPCNIPREIVADELKFFSWDNEKRTPANKPYLFDWSYYNGVVMEGLYDIYQFSPDTGKAYHDYVLEYLNALITADSDGRKHLSPNLAGYVDYHGADCYKTAALLVKAIDENPDYAAIAAELYQDLTDTSRPNSKGDCIAVCYTEESLGHNYWHSWAGQKPPKYKVWLDGIYMLQPFISHYAARIGDKAQLELVNQRLNWVADTMLAPNGMYYHACNGRDDVCPYHWTRAMGWYGMAMVDVTEVLPAQYLNQRKAALRLFADGMLKFQDPSGLWANLADRPATATNRLEVSGTAMMVYTLLKGVRMGWLDDSYREPALRAFSAIADQKLCGNQLQDIYMKAAANNTNNYEDAEYYMPDEGKGSGPFIMAYSEMLYLSRQ